MALGERVTQFSCSFSDSQRGLEQGSRSLNWIATVELNTEPSLPARWNLVALSLIMILVLDGGPQSCDLGRSWGEWSITPVIAVSFV